MLRLIVLSSSYSDLRRRIYISAIFSSKSAFPVSPPSPLRDHTFSKSSKPLNADVILAVKSTSERSEPVEKVSPLLDDQEVTFDFLHESLQQRQTPKESEETPRCFFLGQKLTVGHRR